MRQPDAEFRALLVLHGVSLEEIPNREKWLYQQRWRECYSAGLHAKTGKWKVGTWDWCSFDQGIARCLRGSKALHAFLTCPANQFLLIPEIGRGLRCSALAMPDLPDWPQELFVFPPDLEWTMVFSHEGAFFSRREWQAHSPDDARTASQEP